MQVRPRPAATRSGLVAPTPPPREITHDEPQDQLIAEYWSREQMLAASRERPAVVEPPTEIVLREVVLARHQVSAHQINRSGESELPARPPSAERPAAFARRLATADLESQLDMAARAFARWQGARDSQTLEQLAEGPEQTLNQTLRGIAATSDELRVAVIEAALGGDEPDVHRQQVAMFALLMRDEAHALGLVDARLGDPQLAPALREALSLWRGPQTNAGLRDRARHAGEHRRFWLGLLLDRRADPGRELLRELVASDDPELVLRGLQLAKLHGDPELRRTTAHVYMTDTRHPPWQLAAVELGLFDREPSAWAWCQQLAETSADPRVIELVASFGGASDLQQLLCRPNAARGQDLWRLCRSGRKAAAALAAGRLRDTYGDTLAARGLRYVIGPPANGAKSVEALLQHWTKIAKTLGEDHRYLYGGRFGGTSGLRACLASRDDLHHQALGDELLFRSKGKIRWPGRGFAQDTLAGVKAVGTPNVDFELSFD